ncbi:MAG: hypothetical protein LBT00_04735 [Spirochaetaceae bacterium]|nr:hypothetical protein [Spirochaetaceae bacterium]
MKKIFGLLLVLLSVPLWGQNEQWAQEQARDLAGRQYRYYVGQSAFFARYNSREIESRMITLFQDLYTVALNSTRSIGRNFYRGFYTDVAFNGEIRKLENDLSDYAYTRMRQLFPTRERRGHWETYCEPGPSRPVVVRRMPEREYGRLVQYWVWDN